MLKAKIAVVGPTKSGKSVVCSFLGDQTDRTQSDYQPTAGVRILEFEQQVSNGPRNIDVEVELWDCSGSNEYEGCWPAMADNADGVIILYNPFESTHKSEISAWYDYFVSGRSIKEEYCAVFAHCQRKDATKNISSPLTGVPFYVTNLDGDPDTLRDIFSKFLSQICGKLTESREKEEMSILS